MNRGRDISMAKYGGFTVVETMIFLAVSSALFVSAMLLISGRQNKAQFVNAVRNFESNLIDIANDVANGYYKSNGNVKCNIAAGAPNPHPGGTDTLGTNGECIFIGRVVMTDLNNEFFNTYSLAGLRTSGADVGAEKQTNDVRTHKDARPRLVDVASTIDNKPVGYGATIECIKLDAGSCNPANKAAIAFLTNLRGGLAAANSEKSGAGIHAVLYAYKGMTSYSTTALESAILTTPDTAYDLASFPRSASICIKSGSTAQWGVIKIGTDTASNLTISSEIIDTPCTS